MMGENDALTLPFTMDNLLRDDTPLELHVWLEPDADLPAPQGLGSSAQSGDQLFVVQNYFAEYHLEFFRQRRFNAFPSRLHSQVLFATKVDAEIYRQKYPENVYGKYLVRLRSKGAYLCSFHDASWLDYLRLPHSLGLSALDEISDHYWSGKLVEEIGLTFMDQAWREEPVVEALFQGLLEPVVPPSRSGWLPGF